MTTITLPIDSEAMGLPVDIGQTLSVALTDEDLLIGTGDFVTNALTQAEADSLGASAGYTSTPWATTRPTSASSTPTSGRCWPCSTRSSRR